MNDVSVMRPSAKPLIPVHNCNGSIQNGVMTARAIASDDIDILLAGNASDDCAVEFIGTDLARWLFGKVVLIDSGTGKTQNLDLCINVAAAR